MGDLSRNFSLWEFEKSETAEQYGIDNEVKTHEVMQNLTNLARIILQPIRDYYGRSVNISSGFRCIELNRRVGGATNPPSQHTKGEACDFLISGVAKEEVMRWIVFESGLDFDQVILEPNWIHISYTNRRPNRRQALVKVPGGYAAYQG